MHHPICYPLPNLSITIGSRKWTRSARSLTSPAMIQSVFGAFALLSQLDCKSSAFLNNWKCIRTWNFRHLTLLHTNPQWASSARLPPWYHISIKLLVCFSCVADRENKSCFPTAGGSRGFEQEIEFSFFETAFQKVGKSPSPLVQVRSRLMFRLVHLPRAWKMRTVLTIRPD